MPGLALRLALREMRGGLKGFRVFMACLALGVAAIAGVGALSDAIEAGVRADARSLLGGEVDLRLTHREATAEQLDWLTQHSDRLSMAAQMRAMAIREDGADRRLVEVKAVDGAYPLFGQFTLRDGGALQPLLTKQGDAWGAVVGENLLERLHLKVGDRFRLGDAVARVAGVIGDEPDKSTRAFELGPRVIIANAMLPETGLVQPGSLIRYHYRVDLPDTVAVDTWKQQLADAFPGAGWRVRDLENAAPNIQRFVDRMKTFLTLVGLTALLVGGVGVGNAAKAYLAERTGTIAILKGVGAPSRLIFTTYLLQLLGLGLVGSVIGALLGSLVPFAVAPILADELPVAARAAFYLEPLMLAVLFGVLTTLIFSLWPLSRAREVRAAALFRDMVDPSKGWPGRRIIVVIAALGAVMAGIAILSADNPRLASYFVIGALGTLLLFRGAAWLVTKAAKSLPHPKSMRLRMALTNIHRPGAPTASVVLSMGLGLTVLSAVSLVEANLNREVTDTLRGEAPGFYFIDIQPDQIGPFREMVSGFPTVTESQDVPMLRGRIVAMNGVSVSEITPPPEFAWILRGDRGVTWSRTFPSQGSELVAGKWWQQDYSGPLLVSFDVEAAQAFGLKVGDTLTVNILGREVTAEIANLRKIDWTSLGINFVMVFSPGMLESAPQSYIATARLDEDREVALERKVTDAFPNVSSIRVKEILDGVAQILGNLSVAVRVIASVAILAGVLVLAGAIAAGHHRRIYDSVVLKVLGATRWDVMLAFLLEYLLLGLVTAVVAAGIGTAAAYVVISGIMDAPWSFDMRTLIVTLALAISLTAGLGGAGAWNALGRKAAPFLRND